MFLTEYSYKPTNHYYCKKGSDFECDRTFPRFSLKYDFAHSWHITPVLGELDTCQFHSAALHVLNLNPGVCCRTDEKDLACLTHLNILRRGRQPANVVLNL